MDPVAIIGSGNVGRALGSRLAACDIPVRFGVRDPGREFPDELKRIGQIFTVDEACAAAPVAFLAVPANAAVAAVRGVAGLNGKVLVDCTNPLKWDQGPVWAPPAEGSIAAALASARPDVQIVKGFNYFGAEIHADPRVEGGTADAYLAGESEDAKARVRELGERMGFRVFDAGPLRNAAVLENLAVLWIHLATQSGVGRSFAFGVEEARR